jgi:hypothetical protein
MSFNRVVRRNQERAGLIKRIHRQGQVLWVPATYGVVDNPVLKRVVHSPYTLKPWWKKIIDWFKNLWR